MNTPAFIISSLLIQINNISVSYFASILTQCASGNCLVSIRVNIIPFPVWSKG